MEYEPAPTPSSIKDENDVVVISSPEKEEQPLQDLPSTHFSGMAGPFEPESIAHLPQLTIQQLSELEDQISNEFSALALEYVAARKVRLEYLQRSIETQIKKFQQNDVSWTNFYNEQVQLVERLINSTENQVIQENCTSRSQNKQQHSICDFDREFEQLMEMVESPLQYDDIFKDRINELPFAEYFKEIVDLHKLQLTAQLKQIQYSSNLTKSITEKNKVISWKQYRNDVLNHKEDLIKQTCEQLESLHNEYYGINAYDTLASTNSHYYKSTVPVEMNDTEVQAQQKLLSVKNHDRYHDSDNAYYKRNSIQISDTKHDVQQSYKQFAEQQKKYKIPQLETVLVKLSGCMGATQKEGDDDLALMRRYRKSSKTESHAKIGIPEKIAFSSKRENSYNSDEEEYREILRMGR